MPLPNWYVTPTYVLNTKSNVKYKKPTSGNWNGVALAMNLADERETIGVTGSHTAPSIGVGNASGAHTVKWPEGPVHSLKVYGLDESAQLVGGLALGDDYGGCPYDLKFIDLKWKVTGQSAVLAYMNTGPYSELVFKNITFDTSATNPSNGVPVCKWVFRFHGRSQFRIENCHQTHQNQEHFVYADNVQGDSLVKNCTAVRNGRTMVQIVNRKDSGVSGFGTVTVENCLAIDSGITEQASAFTCAGHMGHVIFKGCKTQNAYGGGLVNWFEPADPSKGKLGAWKNANGYSTNKVSVLDCEWHGPNQDRDAMMISMAEEVELDGNKIVKSNHDGLRLHHQQSIGNGSVKFLSPNPSQGVWNCVRKVVVGWDKNNLKVLTDAEIDAMYVAPTV